QAAQLSAPGGFSWPQSGQRFVSVMVFRNVAVFSGRANAIAGRAITRRASRVDFLDPRFEPMIASRFSMRIRRPPTALAAVLARAAAAPLAPALAVTLLVCGLVALARAEEKRIIILHTTDLHGALTPWDYLADQPAVRG